MCVYTCSYMHLHILIGGEGRERGSVVWCMEDAYPILQRWWKYVQELEPLQTFKKGTFVYINVNKSVYLYACICTSINIYIYIHI
jgi:hypothetical protein